MLQRLKNYFHLLEAITANFIYGNPSKKLNILAVTGTDGKTTSTTLLYHILKTSGYSVALVSTVAAYIGDESLNAGFHVTNPSPFALQKLLSYIVKKNIEFVVLEITSHGIDQYRNFGITPKLAAITNVTHEHLDYHKTYDNYLATKAKLLSSSKQAFINEDDAIGFLPLKDLLNLHQKSFTPFSVNRLPKAISRSLEGRFPQSNYNAQNGALAFTLAHALGIQNGKIATAIKSFPGVPGRMEEVANYKGVRVIVDFAHTPNALKAALKAVRKLHPKGHLINVFGCAGLRDTAKRAMMGKISTNLADYAVFTAEDPRSEDVNVIINQMKTGSENKNRIVSVPDRYAAISFAMTKLAKSGDTVIVTGKGHEQSMCFGNTEYHWSDTEAVHNICQGNTWEWKKV